MTPKIIQEYASTSDIRRLKAGRCVYHERRCSECEYKSKCVLTFKFSGKMNSGWSEQEEKEYQSALKTPPKNLNSR